MNASIYMSRLLGLGVMAIVWSSLGVPAALGQEAEKPRQKPVLRESTIEEADLSGGGNPAPEEPRQAVIGKEERPPLDADAVSDAVPEEAAGMLLEGEEGGLPLLAKVTDKTTPQRAASLKLIDEGRSALEAGAYKQALGAFERAIAVDATNPYSHYFVARAHFFLGNHAESLNFLDVAESLLGWHNRWLAEIHVLKGRNAAGMGFLGRADTNYLEALGLDPYNRFAIERLTAIDQTVQTPLPAP